MSDQVKRAASPGAAARDSVEDAAKPQPRTTRPTIGTVLKSDSVEELLKHAVSGIARRPAENPAETAAEAAATARRAAPAGLARYAAVAIGAIGIGAAAGILATPRSSSGEAMNAVRAALESGRADTARLGEEIGTLARTVSALKDDATAGRDRDRAGVAALFERLDALEKASDGRFVALSQRLEKADREQGAALTKLMETRHEARTPPAAIAATTAATVTPAAQPARQEPPTTGSLAETKAKPDTIEAWAVRDAYAGYAILEDRKHRVIEVGRGDTVPGIGRVEAVERRGRGWVVVTRQGVITPQRW